MKGFEVGMQGTNCYVLWDDKKNGVIVDCNELGPEIRSFIEEMGIHPQCVLLTHGHGDHIGGIEEAKELYGCLVYAHEDEKELLADPGLNLSEMMGYAMEVYPDVFVRDGEVFQIGEMKFKTILTPGHTEGSVCYLVDGEILLSGDTLFAGSCGRTDFPQGDWKKMMHSLKKIASLPGNLKVYPGHGPATSLDIERAMNPFMR